MKSNGKFELRAVIVLYQCSDGKLRPVKFAPKNAKQIHGYITHIQGGAIGFRDDEAIVVRDTPEIRAALAALEKPAPAGVAMLREKLKRFFVSPKPHKAFADPPGEEAVISSSAPSRKIEIASE